MHSLTSYYMPPPFWLTSVSLAMWVRSCRACPQVIKLLLTIRCSPVYWQLVGKLKMATDQSSVRSHQNWLWAPGSPNHRMAHKLFVCCILQYFCLFIFVTIQGCIQSLPWFCPGFTPRRPGEPYSESRDWAQFGKVQSKYPTHCISFWQSQNTINKTICTRMVDENAGIYGCITVGV